MTTENKIKEIEQKQNFQSDWFEEALQEMAEWKDEQHAEEKRQWIEKAVIFLNERVCTEMSIPEIHNMIVDFKQAMKGE